MPAGPRRLPVIGMMNRLLSSHLRGRRGRQAHTAVLDNISTCQTLTIACAPSRRRTRDNSRRRPHAIVCQSTRCLFGSCRRRASRSKLDPVPGSMSSLSRRPCPGSSGRPSDPDSSSRASIRAWSVTEGLANVRAPVSVDVRDEIWDVEDDAPFDAMISLNMVHIARWEAALGLLAGAGRLLKPDGRPRVLRLFMLGVFSSS